MCGVPFHSAETYIARLVAKGYKVAICEQMENPALAKGLVKRGIVRIITPGTVMESSMLDETKNNFLCSLCIQDRKAGVAFADISTGELHATCLQGTSAADLERQLKNELSRFSPREILINTQVLDYEGLAQFVREKLSAMLECMDEQAFSPELCESLVLEQFHKNSLEELELSSYREITLAVGSLLQYLKKTQRSGLERMDHIQLYNDAQFMRLDLNTRRNLELLETMRNQEKRGSLLWVLDKTKTAMGKRLIRSWIEQPLLNPAQIGKRQNAVEELMQDSILCENLAEQLTGIYDLERLMTRIVYGSANGRELRSLCATLMKLPALKDYLAAGKSVLIRDIYEQIDLLEDICSLIDRAIVEDPPFSIRKVVLSEKDTTRNWTL